MIEAVAKHRPRAGRLWVAACAMAPRILTLPHRKPDMPTKWITPFLFVLAMIGSARAAPLPPADVPDQLKSWIPWVLDGATAVGCPHLFNNAETRLCAWPGALELKAASKGASFAQDWRVYRATWAAMPGDERHWPQEVQVDGKPGAVISRDGVPSINLAPGQHHVTGRFLWNVLPESLALPAGAGLLRLDLNGQPVSLPVRDENNRLWLQGKVDSEGEQQAQIRIHRKIVDGVPITVETRIRLEVSGKSRELTVARALLPELIPKALTSPLPAILARDGSLKVQARAGTWEIAFVARHPGPVKTLALAPAPFQDQGQSQDQAAAATEEVWVFEAAPLIRTVSIEGPVTVDPQQTTLPKEWRNLPAYLMRPGAAFRFKEIRRGDSDPAPDKLALERRLWLSFDGSSLTMSDRISGEISRASRLAMAAPAQLGRVDVGGQDQLITRGSDNVAGIEVKRGKLSMSADSLVPDAPRSLPAIGWKHDFDRVSMELALPAGWRLLHASGADRAEGAWLASWDLLDFFLVLVIALAAGKLWGRKWGLLTLVTLVLTYQEPEAPRFAWIALLAAVALVRVLPAGRFKSAMLWVQRASLLALVLIVLGFATGQVRGALYPVLEQGATPSFAEAPAMIAGNVNQDQPETAAAAPERSRSMKDSSKASAPKQQLQRAYQSIDPDAKVQTGPGLPDWRWHTYRLTWDGPVRQDQRLDLWLVSPWANKILVLLRLVLLAFVLACMTGVGLPGASGATGGAMGGGRGLGRFRKPGASVMLALLTTLTTLAVLQPYPVQAALPDKELLDKLKEKLTQPADCLPECAEIARLSVQVSGTTLRLGLDVDAALDTAVPLPGGAKHWLPREATLDGKPAKVVRDGEGGLWLLAPAGRHRVELNGDLPAHDTLQLPLPRKPRRVEVSADGWDVAGLSDDTGAAATLQLSRRIKAGGTTDGPVLPPFLQVERRLVLDLVWRVETTVRRASPLGVPALAQIPLLPGEAVTTAGINVQDGRVLVNLGAQADSLSWSSNLNQRADLKLVAPKDTAWAETWIIAASTLWHVTAIGLAPVAMDASQEADLAFRPWPGETLDLKIERPIAIAGQTMTVDRSTLTVRPGTRATDYQLALTVRSSRGIDHTLTLPEGANLERVSINGQVRPIRANGRQLVLPLVPGKQTIDIVWRVGQAMAVRFATLPVGLNLASVNSRVELQLPQDRWLLFASGPGIGPAILFWGKLLILLAIAFALGRWRDLPMKTRHWMLLALGLTQVPWWAAALVIAWFFAFSWRAKTAGAPNARWLFNLAQLALAALTVAMFGVLFIAVQGGLLGQPEMQVAGNNSTYDMLRWYVDRAGPELKSASVLTLPILVYRALMLVWALWLAWSLLSWLKWGWQGFATNGLWRKKPVLAAPAKEQTGPGQEGQARSK
jgi:hypothetical protein